MKLVGIKFIMGAAWFATVMPEKDARELIQNWMSGNLNLKNVKILGNAQNTAEGWAVKVDSITCIHTFTPQQQELAAAQQQYPGWGSGLPN